MADAPDPFGAAGIARVLSSGGAQNNHFGRVGELVSAVDHGVVLATAGR